MGSPSLWQEIFRCSFESCSPPVLKGGREKRSSSQWLSGRLRHLSGESEDLLRGCVEKALDLASGSQGSSWGPLPLLSLGVLLCKVGTMTSALLQRNYGDSVRK